MSETLVLAENTSKKFCRDLKRSLRYGVQDLASELLGRRNAHSALRESEFWAIKDVSFELKRGEALGLIGPNGAGKTTLLRMLNGLIKPDKGRITMRGRVGALIQLGAGFNPILTGRENIYINAAVLGISKKEIDRKLDGIIDFADIGDFIDAPVRSYSSGMNVRLGFSVAIKLRPDIMLIDEILAVGDLNFRNKCLEAIQEIRDSGVGFVFVSHNLGMVNVLCDRAIYLRSGQVMSYGSTEEVIWAYTSDLTLHKHEGSNYYHQPGTEDFLHVHNLLFLDAAGHPIQEIVSRQALIVRIEFEAFQYLKEPLFHFMLRPFDQQFIVASFNQQLFDTRPSFKPGYHKVDIRIPKFSLQPGRYVLRLTVNGDKILNKYGRVENLATLNVGPRPNQFDVTHGSGYIELESIWQPDPQ